jgi:hypothetical protein
MLAPHLHKSNKPRSSFESLPEEAVVTVLPSSTALFYFYGQSLEQCVSLGVGAGTGKALFDLATVWRKWLKLYAGTPCLGLFWRALFLIGLRTHRGGIITEAKEVSPPAA